MTDLTRMKRGQQTDMAQPDVTVFCPIYNDSIYVDDFVSSVLKQTYKNFKLLVLENGSTDETRAKLCSYDDPRIELVTSHINFRSETGAHLLHNVKTKYLSFIFSDDEFLPEKLETSVMALEESGADACFANNLFMRHDKSPLPNQRVPVSQFSGDIASMSVCEHLWHMVKKGNTLHPVALVIRTNAYLELRGFRPDLHQIGDMELFARLLLLKKVIFIKKPLQRIRLRDAGGVTTNESTVSEAMRIRVRSERMNFLKSFRLPEAMALVDEIFLPRARGIKIPEKFRLWYLGQQFVHEFEPDYRIFGMNCLYDAMQAYGPEIESHLTAAYGVPPGLYMDRLSSQVFSGFALDDSRAVELTRLQEEVHRLRRLLGNNHQDKVEESDTACAKPFPTEISAEALEWFKVASAPKRRGLADLFKRDTGSPYKLPGFDAAYYLANNKDVASSGIDPLIHFLRHGWKEGRNPSKCFNVRGYLNANPDIREAGANPLLHYLEHGVREERNGWRVSS